MPANAKSRGKRGKAAPAGSGRKRRHWLRTALFFLLFPFVVWFIAIVVWFYWGELSTFFTKAVDKPKAAIQRESETGQRESGDLNSKKTAPSQENLLDEDRRKLEDILKQRQ